MPDLTLPARIAAKVRRDDETGCWPWMGFIQSNGYGKVYFDRKVRLAHRVVYELLVGPIPDGLVLDHLCRHRSCVNPAHLRATTIRENTLATGSLARSALAAARLSCVHGHDYTLANTYLSARGRVCRTCHRERQTSRRAAHR